MEIHIMMERKIKKAVKESGQKKVRVIYSAYELDAKDDPIDNLHIVAVSGKVVLVSDRDEFYGGKKSADYRSEVLDNPTWLQVAVCANEMIRVVRDVHHCFLESLEERCKEGDVTVYELVMGS